jgi:membrane protease YdiL (CAAX protease family)
VVSEVPITTLLDLLYVAVFAVVLPVWDYCVWWPALAQQLLADPIRARKRLWINAIGYSWALVAIGTTLWVAHGRPWSTIALVAPFGWRLWTAVGVVALVVLYYLQATLAVSRDPAARASVQRQFTGELATVLPRTRTELTWFGGVALTAGFCEEFLYRGVFIWVLSPWLGWWGAAALSGALFALGHAYQGWAGVVRTGIVGTFFTALVALFDSLWPAMVLHALVDLGGGVIAWHALREDGPAAA